LSSIIPKHPEIEAALLHFLGIEETAAMHSGCLVDQLQQRPWGGWVLLGSSRPEELPKPQWAATKGFYLLVNVDITMERSTMLLMGKSTK